MEDKFSDIKLNTVAKCKNIVTQKLIEVRNSFFVSSYSRQLSLNVKVFLDSLTRLLISSDHSVHHQIPFVAHYSEKVFLSIKYARKSFYVKRLSRKISPS